MKALIERDGVTGVTSNPSIFEKAIGGSSDYDASLKSAQEQADRDVMVLYEALAIEDILGTPLTCCCRSISLAKGNDGYVSLKFAVFGDEYGRHNRRGAAALARSGTRQPDDQSASATEAGLLAIRRLIGEGINVNITLLFSQEVYQQVVEAYLSRFGRFDRPWRRPEQRSRAWRENFFVSRIRRSRWTSSSTTRSRAPNPGNGKGPVAALRGKVAIANAKLAYQHYKRLFAGARWDKPPRARERGRNACCGRAQAPSSKEYSDVLYVDELIAEDTVNTLPPATMDAFRDHGKVSDSLEKDIDNAKQVMAKLGQAGDLDRRGDAKALVGRRRPAFCRRVRQASCRRGAQAHRSFSARNSTL